MSSVIVTCLIPECSCVLGFPRQEQNSGSLITSFRSSSGRNPRIQGSRSHGSVGRCDFPENRELSHWSWGSHEGGQLGGGVWKQVQEIGSERGEQHVLGSREK